MKYNVRSLQFLWVTYRERPRMRTHDRASVNSCWNSDEYSAEMCDSLQSGRLHMVACSTCIV